ncbi:MAG: HAD family phosphatase [Phycisphaerae bacterium]|jgi:beta-phosphoglucomutase family hydrolase
MLRAVIFDFDGVIADSETSHFTAFNKALKSYGVSISRQQYFSEYLGLTDMDLLRTLVEQGILKTEPQQVELIAENKTQIFEEMIRTGADIIDGVADFLLMLEKNKIAKAICSGALAAEIELMLEKGKLRKYFEVIVSAEQVSKGKPAPDGFLLALEKLNKNRAESIAANECIVVEDSHWGLEAGKAAGMHTVAVTNSYGAEELSLAERIVDNLSELTTADLRSLCG